MGSGGGVSITKSSSDGGRQGPSFGHHGGRATGASLEDPSSSPPELYVGVSVVVGVGVGVGVGDGVGVGVAGRAGALQHGLSII